MSKLREALSDAGLKSKKTENMRKSTRGREESKSEKFQQTRNFCEVCELTQPDVEQFIHKNPTIDAEWICSGCADKNSIPDETRRTNQSDFAKAGRYRREFGAVKVFEERVQRPRTSTTSNNKNTNTKRPSNSNNKNRTNSTGDSRQRFSRDDNRKGPGRTTNRSNPSQRGPQGRRPNNRGGNGNHKPAPFTIDEDGEKNFNC